MCLGDCGVFGSVGGLCPVCGLLACSSRSYCQMWCSKCVLKGNVPVETPSAWPRDQRHTISSFVIFSVEAHRFFPRRELFAFPSDLNTKFLIIGLVKQVVYQRFFYRLDRGVLWRPLTRHSDTDVDHVGLHSVVPSRRTPTAIRITSSDRQRLNAVIGWALASYFQRTVPKILRDENNR